MTHSSFSQFEQDILAQPLSLSHPLDSTSDVVAALNILLLSICDKTEWEYGESWLPNATHTLLELSPAWYINRTLTMNQAILWMQFQVWSRAFGLRLSEGMPGRVWHSQQPEWLEDVSAQSETGFLRNRIAKVLSVKAGFGVPILVSTQVLAVVVFFMSKTRSPDPPLMTQTQAIVRNFQYEFSTRMNY